MLSVAQAQSVPTSESVPTTNSASSTDAAPAAADLPKSEGQSVESASAVEKSVEKPVEKKITWKGDVRLRGQVENIEAADSRKYARLRARLGTRIRFEEGLSGELRLATTTNYRSTNQSLGDDKDPGFTRRSIGLDLAYADWQAQSWARLNAGRIPQWHQRPGGSQALLDEDIALEGFSLRGEVDLTDSWSFWWGFGSALIRENYDSLVYSEDHTDNFLHTGDLALLQKAVKLKIGVSFFNFVGLQGRLFSELAAGGAPLGNSEFPAGTVKNNYRPLRFYVEQGFAAGSGDWNVFAERIVNEDTRDPNKATWLGFGYVRKPWSAQLAFAEIESDAVPAVFTFSDFAAGQTEARGLVGSIQYQLGQNISLKYTHFANRQSFSEQNRQYVRSHLDLAASF